MTWATPKTDWNANYVPSATDLNRIEENTRIAARTLGAGANEETITSANNLDITDTTNCFYISGTTRIDYIKTTGRLSGSIIFLTFASSSCVLKNNAGAAPANYAKINSGGDFNVAGAEQSVALVYNGTDWRLIYRFS
jgi:hypothetical protein